MREDGTAAGSPCPLLFTRRATDGGKFNQWPDSTRDWMKNGGNVSGEE